MPSPLFPTLAELEAQTQRAMRQSTRCAVTVNLSIDITMSLDFSLSQAGDDHAHIRAATLTD
ncbi:hypothetical protein CIT25_35385 [Mesorhizobium mediterraneum]|uniref:Uncharacterized protein n=1 Tax=Mesorhizobium mediterraneum TaxID=43617 RepID=A0AB36QYV4_9HYPH|nr:hypothetical protein CIT25_35385 [Mesorhizobium mediterraneum]